MNVCLPRRRGPLVRGTIHVNDCSYQNAPSNEVHILGTMIWWIGCRMACEVCLKRAPWLLVFLLMPDIARGKTTPNPLQSLTIGASNLGLRLRCWHRIRLDKCYFVVGRWL